MADPAPRPADEQAAANRRGVIALVGAMAIYLLSDVLAKLVTDRVETAEMMVVRGLAAALATLIMLVASGQHRRMRLALTPLILLRSLLDGGATWTFLAAIREIPLATATTIALATPLVMMPMAVLFLREHVNLKRWLATAVGFAGVLLVMQPDGEWQMGAIYAVACTAIIAVREIITRKLPLGAPTLGVTLMSALAISAVGAAGTLGDGWRAMDWEPFWIIVAAGFLNAWGNYLNTTAFRIGLASVVAPFRYTTIPLSFAAGYIFWGTVPTMTMVLGALLILAAGLVVLRSDRPARRPPADA